MCEREYAGCRYCERPASESMYMREYRTEAVDYSLDDYGEPTGEPDYEYIDGGSGDTTYFCQNCGETSLVEGLSAEDCECAECAEDAEDSEPAEFLDDNALVCLSRAKVFDFRHHILGQRDVPPEITAMWTDQADWLIIVPQWRSRELWDEWREMLNTHSPPPPDAVSYPYCYDNENRKVVTNDGKDVTACA